jgi:hypothetical protein
MPDIPLMSIRWQIDSVSTPPPGRRSVGAVAPDPHLAAVVGDRFEVEKEFRATSPQRRGAEPLPPLELPFPPRREPRICWRFARKARARFRSTRRKQGLNDGAQSQRRLGHRAPQRSRSSSPKTWMRGPGVRSSQKRLKAWC